MVVPRYCSWGSYQPHCLSFEVGVEGAVLEDILKFKDVLSFTLSTLKVYSAR